jgi:hypothetical protein
MPGQAFTAHIRWQADVDPGWEIETLHSGFDTAEDAALFANGFLEPGADELRLDCGHLSLTLTDHSSIDLVEEAIRIWRLPDSGEDFQVADDSDFQQISMTLAQLSALGFDGGFVQIKYGVTDTAGAQVQVALTLNETGNLSVTVEEASPEPMEEASFAFGIIPRA